MPEANKNDPGEALTNEEFFNQQFQILDIIDQRRERLLKVLEQHGRK